MTEEFASGSAHCVAVIGGATAGAEVAARLAERGAQVAVFEQNPRPYGKIEDGLPRWHVHLRKKEYRTIGEKLSRKGVHYVPNTRIGVDIDFRELTEKWGFTAVVLANGAWRDRPLPVEGADEFIDKGLIYQNPFVIWFNHSGEAAYDGPRFDVPDGAMVVGGGLASIDVAKILMLETTRAKLAERGIEVGVTQLEVKGIPKILAGHDLAFEDLGLEGCTIFYRRDVEDMPLSEIPEGATPERVAKVRAGRRRILEKATRKFLFTLEPLCAPDGLLTEGDRLVGLRFRRTKIEQGRVVLQDETFERCGSCVISSIGSIPEPIEGIGMKGELFDFADWDIGRIDGYPTVFSVGNVVTGKGNIVASRKHATHVSQVAIEKFLGLDEDRDGEEALSDAANARAEAEAEEVADQLERQPPAPPEAVAALLERVRARQEAVGYGGDYKEWISQVTPPDLE
jgi:NADPH-dependent glutamate synthase beta subunit-like oxidoreductase